VFPTRVEYVARVGAMLISSNYVISIGPAKG
jgi:hypothetical protein